MLDHRFVLEACLWHKHYDLVRDFLGSSRSSFLDWSCVEFRGVLKVVDMRGAVRAVYDKDLFLVRILLSFVVFVTSRAGNELNISY